MADGTPSPTRSCHELKKKYDEIKVTLEADLIGSFENPYPWHQMEGILTARSAEKDEYIQRFRNLRNRCYSVRITEKEAVELAVAGLATQLKDMASQADYPSLAHMVQKLSAYEQRHPDLYQDKFKRA
ncbi:hypothetical protein QYE76_066310 [Lolium multiflorum]|uniref:Uncharacterized protein n=1 Tax=Lolium multiflorum TaxID=4521 RepID=A0AAD8SAS3_LOLMU|nr:hypothetical protein QYE76_066310 [Lolium multiflorum]